VEDTEPEYCTTEVLPRSPGASSSDVACPSSSDTDIETTDVDDSVAGEAGVVHFMVSNPSSVVATQNTIVHTSGLRTPNLEIESKQPLAMCPNTSPTIMENKTVLDWIVRTDPLQPGFGDRLNFMVTLHQMGVVRVGVFRETLVSAAV